MLPWYMSFLEKACPHTEFRYFALSHGMGTVAYHHCNRGKLGVPVQMSLQVQVPQEVQYEVQKKVQGIWVKVLICPELLQLLPELLGLFLSQFS